MNITTKPVNRARFALALLPIVFISLNAGAQTKPAAATPSKTVKTTPAAPTQHKMVQSAFYDANAMYWALQGYNAYPVLISAAKPAAKQATQTGKTNPGAKKDSTQKTKPAGGANTAPKPQRKNNGPGGPYAGDQAFAYPLAATTLAGIGGGQAFAASATDTSISYYEVIELTTGKILMDKCAASDLNTIMKQHLFTDSEKVDFINGILSRNAGDSIVTKYKTQAAIYQHLSAAYLGNGYMTSFFAPDKPDYLNSYTLPGATLNNQGGTAVVTSSSTSGSTGKLPTVTSLVQGLVDFDIQAVNAEIDEAFFVHLQEVLQQRKELAILFPKTLQSLNKISVTSYTQSLAAIRSAYETDMKSLLGNISGLVALPNYQKVVGHDKALTLVFAACDLVAMLQKGKSVPDILYAINNAAYVTQISTNDYNSALRLAAVFSNAFVDIKLGDKTPKSLTWVVPAMLDSLRNNTMAGIDRFKIFMGLFAENCKGITIGDFDVYSQLTSAGITNVLQKSYIIYNYANTYNTIKAAIDSANKATDAAARAGIYIDITTQLLNLAGNTLDVFESDQTTAIRAQIDSINKTYMPLLKNADSVAYDVENKAYSTAIYAADTLINSVLKSVKLYYKTDPHLVADTALINDVMNYYVKYGSFIAAVALSQNDTDVKNAIQTFALPTGSSRIKKEHDFSWGLNSYAGVYHCWNTGYAKNNMPAQETGITAPVGIALNWGHFADGSLSIYGGIIDVGAIFSYTASTNNTVQSQIKLGQILSPSLGLVYGFPILKKYNIPISIGANYQWGPALKDVDTNGNSVLSKLTGRFNVFLAIDIPMFNFGVSKN